MKQHEWIDVDASELPRDLKWETRPEDQGQIVTYSYAEREGTRYRRRFDAADRTTTYDVEIEH